MAIVLLITFLLLPPYQKSFLMMAHPTRHMALGINKMLVLSWLLCSLIKTLLLQIIGSLKASDSDAWKKLENISPKVQKPKSCSCIRHLNNLRKG
ncbi:hypothetical protein MANES_12G081216v8 [Manihot esculenta]|uniref:Uncharacterized protein n=1 Tax=Manihot esculenta TaxID=3983 RepID=A0ACB7GRN0_MANES|nr:hypothetical protein MANES_12G081216v8 [Manihot esculenta]